MGSRSRAVKLLQCNNKKKMVQGIWFGMDKLYWYIYQLINFPSLCSKHVFNQGSLESHKLLNKSQDPVVLVRGKIIKAPKLSAERGEFICNELVLGKLISERLQWVFAQQARRKQLLVGAASTGAGFDQYKCHIIKHTKRGSWRGLGHACLRKFWISDLLRFFLVQSCT